MTREETEDMRDDGRLHPGDAAVPLFASVRAHLAARGVALELALPASVAAAAAQAALMPGERELARPMCATRRHEFSVGRICARQAIDKATTKTVTGTDSVVEILQGDRGEPLWPDGLAGSITHTPGLVAAAVMRRADCKTCGVGIDVERATRVLSDGAWRHVLSADEETRLSGVTDPVLRLVLFSAKESLYKALYPSCGIFFGFEDASLWFDDDAAGRSSGSAKLRLERDLGDAFRSGQVFTCVWEIDGAWLFTGVIAGF